MASLHEFPSLTGVVDGTPRDLDLTTVFARRIQAERALGLAQYRSGSVIPFAGYDYASLIRKIVVSAEFDEPSRDEIATTVTQPLAHLAHAHGFELGIPGEMLLPSHVTLQIIEYDSDQDMQGNLGKISPYLESSASVMEGLVIPFNSLVLTGTRMILCMGNPAGTDETVRAYNGIEQSRWAVRHVNSGEGLLRTDSDIVHTSIGRVTRIDEPNFLSFVAEANHSIGARLSFSPVRAKVASIFVGSGVQQISKVSPQLFAKR